MKPSTRRYLDILRESLLYEGLAWELSLARNIERADVAMLAATAAYFRKKLRVQRAFTTEPQRGAIR